MPEKETPKFDEAEALRVGKLMQPQFDVAHARKIARLVTPPSSHVDALQKDEPGAARLPSDR